MASKIIPAKLKPCPFCGGGAQMKQGKTVFVECMRCHAFVIKMSIDDAMRGWNHRAKFH